MAIQLFRAHKQADLTRISKQATSWVDDFNDWARADGCCKYFSSNGTFCPHTYSNNLCDSCRFDLMGLSRVEYFNKFVRRLEHHQQHRLRQHLR
jgi:Niemann-Pick C1 protein